MPFPVRDEIVVTTDGEKTVKVVITDLIGTEETPIVIDTEWLEIDGGGTQAPCMKLDGCQYVQLSNLYVHDSAGSVVQIVDTSHCTFTNIIAKDASGTTNHMVWSLESGADNNTFTDCVGVGTGRKMFQCYYADDNVFNRCFGRWEYSTLTSPKIVFAPAYNSFRNTCNYCIGEVNVAPPAGAGTFTGIFSADNMDGVGGAASNAVCTQCLSISKLAVNSTVSGAAAKITFTNHINATKTGKDLMSRALLLTLRDQWISSTVLDELESYCNINVIGIIDKLRRWKWRRGLNRQFMCP